MNFVSYFFKIEYKFLFVWQFFFLNLLLNEQTPTFQEKHDWLKETKRRKL